VRPCILVNHPGSLVRPSDGRVHPSVLANRPFAKADVHDHNEFASDKTSLREIAGKDATLHLCPK
jgi:hypothetical protein